MLYLVSDGCGVLVIVQSSLAAARADNFYYPPEWTPKKVSMSFVIDALDHCLDYDYLCLVLKLVVFFQGSLNKFHGQHALRERARKIDQGILIIRYGPMIAEVSEGL